MTKVLARKSSIPNESGDIKQSICDFDVIHALQMDIEMYNYLHSIFKDYFSGKLRDERRLASLKLNTEQMFSKVLKERIDYNYMPALTQIEQDLTKRSNSDIMNNYFIDMVTRSFTTIEETLFAKFEN
jgi:hypothetical protein